VTGEVHYVDCGYNSVAMPTLEALKTQEQAATAAGHPPSQAAE
jgi:enoyl-[acyl-carrier protein] reductase I